MWANTIKAVPMRRKHSSGIYAILKDPVVRLPLGLFSETHFNKNAVTGWCKIAEDFNSKANGIDKFYTLRKRYNTIGYFSGGPAPDKNDKSVWTIGCFLDRRYHGQGIMTQIISEFIEEARRQSLAKSFEAAVKPDNHPSQKLLEKLGFHRTGQYSEWSHFIIHKDGRYKTEPCRHVQMDRFELKLT